MPHLCDEEGKSAFDYARDNGLDEEIVLFKGESNNKLKQQDMAKKKEQDRNNAGTLANSFKNRKSILQKRQPPQNREQDPNGNTDAIGDHFNKLGAETGMTPDSAAAAAASIAQNPTPQKVITKIVHKADPKL